MKILHYVSSFSPRSETFIYDLVSSLGDGAANHVLAHRRELREERPFPRVTIIDDKVPLIQRLRLRLLDPWGMRNKREVFAYIAEMKPDLLHAHFGTNGARLHSLIVEHDIQIPLVVSFHGYDVNTKPARDQNYLKALRRMAADKRVVFTCPSEFLKEKAHHLGLRKAKIRVITNSCNDMFRKNLSRPSWSYGDELKLLNVGRFEVFKGQLCLINAFRKIVNYYPNCMLTLIGSGSMESKLRNRVHRLNLSGNVIFLKEVAHEDLPEIMSRHHLYIHPSIVTSDGAEESLSVSTVEAQAMGLPAIVSDIGGLREVIVDQESGFLVPQKDENAILEKVRFYVERPDVLDEHSARALTEVGNKFDRQRIRSQWMALYHEMISAQFSPGRNEPVAV